MRKFFALFLILFGALFSAAIALVNFVGGYQTAETMWASKNAIVKVIAETPQLVPLGFFFLGMFALACIYLGSPKQWLKPDPLRVLLTPSWSSPQLATVVNDEHYPAHVKRSTLYGIKWFGRERLYEAARFNNCVAAPYSIEAQRRVEQAYGGNIPFDKFRRLQAEIELETGKVFVSKKVKTAKPPISTEQPEQLPERPHSEPDAEETVASFTQSPSNVAKPAESPELSALRDKLKMLLEKSERIKDTPDSQGFDMTGARARNQRFISEVREEIKRHELDGFIREADSILELWRTSQGDALAVLAVKERSLQWLRTATDYVESNFDADRRKTFKTPELAITSGDIFNAMMKVSNAQDADPVVKEIAFKRQILVYFRKGNFTRLA